MPLLTALVNVLGRLLILLVQLAVQAVFGLAKALGAVIAALWRERHHRTQPGNRPRGHDRRQRRTHRA